MKKWSYILFWGPILYLLMETMMPSTTGVVMTQISTSQVWNLEGVQPESSTMGVTLCSKFADALASHILCLTLLSATASSSISSLYSLHIIIHLTLLFTSHCYPAHVIIHLTLLSAAPHLPPHFIVLLTLLSAWHHHSPLLTPHFLRTIFGGCGHCSMLVNHNCGSLCQPSGVIRAIAQRPKRGSTT